MRYKIMLALTILLLFVGSASAAFDVDEFERIEVGTGSVASVTGLVGRYRDACASFTWTGVSDADHNYFIVRVSSNNPEFNFDINQAANSYSACTIVPGEWVKAVIYRIDSNGAGIYLNVFPDANVTVFPGNVTQAGTYLVYNLLVAIGSLVGLMILGFVFVVVFKRLGTGNPLTK